jgi:hypothetical protein
MFQLAEGDWLLPGGFKPAGMNPEYPVNPV